MVHEPRFIETTRPNIMSGLDSSLFSTGERAHVDYNG